MLSPLHDWLAAHGQLTPAQVKHDRACTAYEVSLTASAHCDYLDAVAACADIATSMQGPQP